MSRTGQAGHDDIADIGFSVISGLMVRPLRALVTLLGRWSTQQETALLQMMKRKKAGQRLAGFSKSERADAKFLLLAAAPFSVLAFVDYIIGSPRGAIWQGLFWLSAIWAVCIFAVGVAAYGRAMMQASRERDG